MLCAILLGGGSGVQLREDQLQGARGDSPRGGGQNIHQHLQERGYINRSNARLN